MKNQICMLCHDNRTDQLKSRIRNISELLRNTEPVRNSRYKFMWNFGIRCKYGLQCDTINRDIGLLEKEVAQLEDKLVAVALGDDERLYFRVIDLLRGQFSSIYSTMTKIHYHKNS